jgi:hypothetical protein
MDIDPKRISQGDGSKQCLPKLVEEYLQEGREGTSTVGCPKALIDRQKVVLDD